MKALILGFALTLSASAFAMDPASQFVETTLTNGKQLLAQKGANRTANICQLVRTTIDYKYMGKQWLGNYANLNSDPTGVNSFIKSMPSLLVGKMVSLLGSGAGSITVNPNSTDRGNGVFAVGVTIHNGSGNPYSGTALVRTSHAGHFLIYDGEYFGFSGVAYLASDFQNKLNAAASSNPKTPVSDVVHQLQHDPSYIQCP